MSPRQRLQARRIRRRRHWRREYEWAASVIESLARGNFRNPDIPSEPFTPETVIAHVRECLERYKAAGYIIDPLPPRHTMSSWPLMVHRIEH